MLQTKDETKIKNSSNGEATGPNWPIVHPKGKPDSKPNRIQIKTRHHTPRSLFLAVGHCVSRRNLDNIITSHKPPQPERFPPAETQALPLGAAHIQ